MTTIAQSPSRHVSRPIPLPGPEPSAAEVAKTFLERLACSDFEGLADLVAPDVWLRALLPKRVREGHSAEELLEAYREWFAVAAELRLEEVEHHSMEGREHVRYRYLIRPDWQPDTWHRVEQSGYCRVRDGRISRLDLVCTGYHALGPGD